MTAAKVLLLRTAGTNCDEESRFAFETVGGQVTPLHVRALCEKPDSLRECRILMVPGGFSYGDDLGSGAVLAHELLRRLREPIERFVEDGGLILGVCNGFQVLVRAGLLPESRIGSGAATEDEEASRRSATLTFNDSRVFEDRWVCLRVGENDSPFLRGKSGAVVTFPVAHGEGKFVSRDAGVLRRLKQSGRIAFRYVAAAGGRPAYPENPNGSEEDLAGVVDETGRILGLMPHPERHVLPWQHPRWTAEGLSREPDGLFIFRNAVEYAKQG
jgi:phosphoribosylformylglycinamidine synthase